MYQNFQRIIASGKHLARLIDDILALSRISRLEYTKQMVDLSVIARDIIDNLQQCEPGRQVRVKITPHLLCKGDVRLLRSALENLLGIAWKYSSKNSKAPIEFGISEINNEKVYYVRDNGAGFDARYADDLFKPFKRVHTSDEFEGTGIGLATVQRMITRHGGTVWAKAEVNHGATFYFILKKAGGTKDS